MAQPTPYSPLTAFLSYQAATPAFPGQQLDAEFNNLVTAISGIDANLKLIQRDDGALANGSVTYNTLSPALQTAGLQPLSTWAAGVRYQQTQTVLFNSALYQSTGSYVAGTSFATDLAAGKWTFLSNLAILSGSSTALANTVAAGPTSGAAATPSFRSLVIADLPTAIPNANLATPSFVIGTSTLTLGSTQTTITGLSSPSNPSDVAIKSYVDSVAAGLSIRNSVTCATVAALPTCVYANGTSGVGATLTVTATGTLTIDGHLVALNDRVLVQNEVTAANNGIYLCTTAGAVAVSAVLTRAVDANQTSNLFSGVFTMCEVGTLNLGAGFVLTTTGAITVGSTALTFTQFSGVGEITAGANITKTGNTLSVSTSPSFTTPNINVATATSINGLTLTASTGVLTLTNAKTLAVTNTLTLSGTDSTTITFQGTDTYVGRATTDVLTNKTFDTAGTGNVFKINGLQITSNTGSTAVNVMQTSPTLITPVLGVATATSINKLTLTAPATGATLTLTDGKTLAVTNTLTLSGTDGTTMTFPAVSSTVMTIGNSATLTVGMLFTAYSGGTISSGTYTPAAANGNYQYITNNGAFAMAVPAADSAIDILITNGASAGAITFSGSYTISSAVGDALTTINTNKFIVSIRRINGVSTYLIKALQ